MTLDGLKIILVIGSQRSGTTLVGQILGAHPNAVLIDESNGLYQWTDALIAGEPNAHIAKMWRKVLRGASANYIPRESATRITSDFELTSEVTHLILKAPNLTYSADDVARTFPGASVIYMMRDIRDVVASMMRLEHIPIVRNQISRLRSAPSLHHRFDKELARLESESVSKVRKMAIIAGIKMSLDATFSDAGLNVERIKYEDLVSDSDTVIAQALHASGLSENPSCANFHRRMRGWGPGLTERTRPIDSRSRDNWRVRLSDDEAAEIWDESSHLMTAWGYESDTQRPVAGQGRHIADGAIDSPVIALGRGGGGTRILSAMLQDMGIFLGNRLNPSEDSMEWASVCYEMLIRSLREKAGASSTDHNRQDWTPILRRHAAEILGEGVWDQTQPWGLKLPEVTLVPHLFNEAFPEARFIHLIRDPISASLRRLHKTSAIRDPIGRASLKAAYSHHGRPLERIETDDNYLKNAFSWAFQVGQLSEFGRNHLPADRYLEIRFEDICDAPETSFHRMANFLGIDPGDRFRAPKIDRERLERYERPVDQMAEVWDICGEVGRRFGYLSPSERP